MDWGKLQNQPYLVNHLVIQMLDLIKQLGKLLRRMHLHLQHQLADLLVIKIVIYT